MHSRPTGHLVKAFRREVQSLDENLPVYDVRSLEDRIALNRLEVSLFRIWPISSPKPAMSRWLPICFRMGTNRGPHALFSAGRTKLTEANGMLFVTGFCWLGSQGFCFATDRADPAAAFVFYGLPRSDLSGTSSAMPSAASGRTVSRLSDSVRRRSFATLPGNGLRNPRLQGGR